MYRGSLRRYSVSGRSDRTTESTRTREDPGTRSSWFDPDVELLPSSVQYPIENPGDGSGYSCPSSRVDGSGISHTKEDLGNCLSKPTSEIRFVPTSIQEVPYPGKDVYLDPRVNRPEGGPTTIRESFCCEGPELKMTPKCWRMDLGFRGCFSEQTLSMS